MCDIQKRNDKLPFEPTPDIVAEIHPDQKEEVKRLLANKPIVKLAPEELPEDVAEMWEDLRDALELINKSGADEVQKYVCDAMVGDVEELKKTFKAEFSHIPADDPFKKEIIDLMAVVMGITLT